MKTYRANLSTRTELLSILRILLSKHQVAGLMFINDSQRRFRHPITVQNIP